ncbi:MAG: oligosaccharide flippase family protein [Candidatus Pacebacteria bacterium]|nr:oligosaccharide flippase family protein [Candidatus Paceibacterota bacterium]
MIKKTREKIYVLSQRWGGRLGLDLPYFVKNGFWVALRQGAGVVAGLALSVTFARLASQEVYGQYQFVLSVLSIVSILSIPGLNLSITQSAARGHDGDYKEVVKVSFLWSLLGIPALLAVGAYYYATRSHPLGIAFMITAIFFPFFYAPNTWDSFLQGKGRFDVVTKYGIVQSMVNALATMVVIFFSRTSLIPIIMMYLVSYTFFNGYFYWRSLRYIENGKKDKDVFRYGWFMNKINFLGVIAANIDSVLVGIFLGPVNLAVYAIVSLVSNRLSALLKSFFSVIFPKIAQSEKSFSELLKIHRSKVAFFVFFSFVSSAIFYAFIPGVNQLLFGDKYAPFFSLSRIFFISIFFYFSTAFFGYYVNAVKDNLSIWLSGPVFYVIKIIINFYLIFYYHLIGAIWAANLIMIILFILYILGILRTEKNRHVSGASCG